jgi:hypothetical protein
MIKKLFFTATLLAPCLAYGAGPSADLSVQITPAGSGPPAPAQAQAAGFTSNVLKADFTVPGNSWSNPASYVVNCGAAASVANQPSTWHFTFFHWANSSERMPCTDTSIVTDPVSGGQVLDAEIKASEYSGDLTVNNGAVLGFPSPAGLGVNTSWLPNEIYTKITLRLDSASYNQGSNIHGLYDWWSTTTAYGTAWVDIDVAEIAFGGGTSYCGGPNPSFYGQLNQADHTQPIQYSGALCYSTDPTQYHTLEALTTSDEKTNLAFCEWFDGTFVGCKSPFSLTYDNGYAYNLRDRSTFLSVLTNGASSVSNDIHVYIKSMEIWTCANYTTSTCPGTIVDHWPFP